MHDTDYALLGRQAEALVADEPDALANTANLCALLYHSLASVNWARTWVVLAIGAEP